MNHLFCQTSIIVSLLMVFVWNKKTVIGLKEYKTNWLKMETRRTLHIGTFLLFQLLFEKYLFFGKTFTTLTYGAGCYVSTLLHLNIQNCKTMFASYFLNLQNEYKHIKRMIHDFFCFFECL